MFAISPTDIDWFKFLRSEGYNSQINFWTPTPWNISKLSADDKLYFMLKSPIRKISGYGKFIRYKNMTVNSAWNKFGLKNGCASKQELVQRLDKYKSNRSLDDKSVLKSGIGCIILNDVEFFDDENFLDLENYKLEFSKSIVKIKYYKEPDPMINTIQAVNSNFNLLTTTAEKLKKSRLITERKGQGTFRAKITSAYSNKCCITGETTPELIEAAHIQPYIDESSNHVKNGLLLRVDLHKLYDTGLLFIDENYCVHISPQVTSDYYQNLTGTSISIPASQSQQPSKEALESKKKEFRNE